MLAFYIEYITVTVICILICLLTFLWVTILPAIGLMYVCGFLD